MASLADRAWLAFQALPRNERGELPEETKIESATGLSRGLLGKIFSGKQHGVTTKVLPRLARALGTTQDFLTDEAGTWPQLKFPPRPRKVKYDGNQEIPEKLVGTVTEPGQEPPVVGLSEVPRDTLAMASEAAECAAAAGLMTTEEAWGRLRGVHLAEPSVSAYLETLRKMLELERAPRSASAGKRSRRARAARSRRPENRQYR